MYLTLGANMSVRRGFVEDNSLTSTDGLAPRDAVAELVRKRYTPGKAIEPLEPVPTPGNRR